MSAEALNLQVISEAIDQHNRNCDYPAVAVALSGFEAERLGWDEIKGLPIIVDDKLGTGRFRVVCEREQQPEEPLEAVAEQEREVKV